MRDVLLWVAPGAVVAAVLVAWSDECSVWEKLAEWASGLWRFCGEIGAVLMPALPPKGRNPRPRAETEEEALDRHLRGLRDRFASGAIDVDMFEAEVESALSDGVPRDPTKAIRSGISTLNEGRDYTRKRRQ